MGELIRRLDYERRSRKRSLLVGSSVQRINKEYSNKVRSANEMEGRRQELFVKQMDFHKRLFLNRFAYEKKLTTRFKKELDAKTQDFNEEKFQMLRRAQSARGKLQSGYQDTNIGTVTELVPRHLYRQKSAHGVKFEGEESSESDDDDDVFDCNVAIVDKTGACKDFCKDVEKTCEDGSMKQENNSGSSLTRWSVMWRRTPKSVLRRRQSYAVPKSQVESPIPVDAKGRRQSAPPHAVAAYLPPDPVTIKKMKSQPYYMSRPLSSKPSLRPRSASQANIYKQPITSAKRRETVPDIMARRGSVSSVASTLSVTGSVSLGDDKETQSRSFRSLREAFKKIKIEVPDPTQERFNLMKADHTARTENLHEETLQQFEKLFTEGFFEPEENTGD